VAGKGTAASHCADDFQFCLVAFKYVFDDSQPEAGSPGIPRMAGIDTIQPFSQAGYVAGGNAFAGIRDTEVRTRMIHMSADTDFGLLRCVPDGIVNQV
jgi:hypothetical protein